MSTTTTLPPDIAWRQERHHTKHLARDFKKALKRAIKHYHKRAAAQARGKYPAREPLKGRSHIGVRATEIRFGRYYYQSSLPLLEELVTHHQREHPEWRISLRRSLYYFVVVTPA